jgi:hypothetical protein
MSLGGSRQYVRKTNTAQPTRLTGIQYDNFLFMVYVMTLLVQNDRVGKVYKEAIADYKYYPDICLGVSEN